ncbi:kinase suppressor of Ras 2-like [Oppia nitens]|uniref:kinase suppressor of Ras 2-like n=1 Tax=Oppia nitens TaxID=1686743 RepID=UPI0023D9D440|nr:kinase suppressor of Ras 2-like [Oppia nitens]XP_054155447.1 kinase suppressor of Ras 2-like [Oppia nitens]
MMSINDCRSMNNTTDDCVRKTIDNCLAIQAMIDINAKHLEGLRTECSITAELTQNEIRTLESKLVKLFSRQLAAKRKCRGSHEIIELKPYPHLRQWLRIVGLSDRSINVICNRVMTFDALLKSSEQQMKEILHENESREEEIRRILTALKSLKLSIDKVMAGELLLDDLHWDSWDRTKSTTNTNTMTSSASASPRITRNRTMRTSVPSEDILKNNSPLSPPQSAGLWFPQTGSYILNSNLTSTTNSMDSRRPTPPPTPPIINKNNSRQKFPTTPPPGKRNLLVDPFPLTKSKSHEEHLAHRIEPLDPAVANQVLLKYITNASHNHHNSLDNLGQTTHRRRLQTEPGLGHSSPIMMSPSRSPPVASPDQQHDNCFVDTPVAPRSPRSHGMAHSIHHRFSTTMKINSTCNLCEKPMFIGYKCKECKYRCHRDCVDKVPNSCGLPNEFVDIFKQSINNEERRSPIVLSHAIPNMSVGGGGSSRSQSEILGRKVHKKRTHYNQPMINLPSFAGHDSSSNTSSCNSSTPSSPALIYPSMPSSQTTPQSASRIQQFQFPEITIPYGDGYNNTNNNHINTNDGSITIETKPFSESEVIDTQKSTDSDKTVSGTSGSGSTDSEKTLAGRVDSQDSQASDLDPNDKSWPRQNSLTLREWDIPFDELKIEEAIGTGRFGTVFKGNWHGSVAIKRLNMNNVLDDKKTIESFKQEVATFRKTRHDNLVLFMGACMKPPHLAIVTSLCKGMTLYTHIHLRRDKFNLNRTITIAQQICQGMGYLHARGIVHKDLKSKNIFYENGKVVITDFGLFSVAKLCVGNRKGDWLTIPKGWLCYLAPEIVRSLRIHSEQDTEELPFSTATDVYAFGTVWYELLLGEWPFKGQPSEVIIWQVGKGVKQSLMNLQASKEVKDLLLICWSFKSNERTEFSKLYEILTRLPKKRLQRSPSHPIHLLRSAESLF